jgi:para-aminobenzoate synthetase/4-amino-4-deoxychorismate lyase
LWFGVFDHPQTPETAAASSDHSASTRAYAGPLTLEWDEAAYRTRFKRVHDLIGAGDLYQANLSFRARFAFAGDPLSLYRVLLAKSQAGHCAYVDDGEHHILSLSPELFFEASPDGTITARPMKGTAARGADSKSDAAARARLIASEKDRAENLMIVDLLRNDLSRVAEIGSVAVDTLFAVETYPTLHQMVSTISARRTAGTGVEQIVRALFPCGSVTGAPKIRAMEVIRELETSPRGVYCGAIGAFAPDGSARFNVAIRTLTIKGNRGELGIGGAVVHDSRDADEYAECLLKARYYEVGRRPLELIETLRYSRREGFVREALHMDRIRRSAKVFGIPFERHCALQRMQDAVAGAADDRRVRLSLSESREISVRTADIEAAPLAHWTYAISPRRVASTDGLLRHKTSWRESFDEELARLAAEFACDEVLFLNEGGEITEGSRTNVFARIDGKLLTPPLSAGVLDGCLRRALIEEGRCVEATLMPEDLEGAEKVFLGNSLRGLIPARPVESAPSLLSPKEHIAP